MEEKKKQMKVLDLIEKIDNKDFGFYFFTLDTKGNPTAGIANIYEQVKTLTDLGYNAYILHEKNDYHGVHEWLGDAYANLPHVSVEEQNLNLTAIDYLIVPEIFANVMEQVKEFPCKKIVLSQSYTYILELLKILEEPPDQTIFILVSNNTEKLLPTIISRVQQIPFQQCSEDEISNGLIKHFGVSDEVSKQSALLANGNYAEAILILTNNEESISFLNNFQNFMRLTLRFDCGKVLQWIDDNAATGREKQKQFLQYALEVFRDSLMFNYGDKNLVRLTGQEYQFLEKFAPFINHKNCRLHSLKL